MQCILLKTVEGVDIIYPVSRSIEDIILLELPSDSIYSIIDQSTIPATRTFRGAWAFQGGQLDVDLDIARVIQKDRWRAARTPLLAQLDLDYMRALETNDAVAMAAVVSKKQALRDITQIDLSGVTTAAELEAVWPEILK
jgi:hypothetical protein